MVADAGPNAGDTAWLLTATALVLFMTLPGLAAFYSGLVRRKNVLSLSMQCFAIACLDLLPQVRRAQPARDDVIGKNLGKHFLVFRFQ